MAPITAIFLFLAGILATASSGLLIDEVKTWIPWIVQRVIRSSINLLPPDQRDRFEEEWRSHIADLPGELGKLIATLGFPRAALKTVLAEMEHKSLAVLPQQSSSAAGDDAESLREHMNLVAAKLLDYSYFFPLLCDPATASERDEILKYYRDNVRPELKDLVSKFAAQAEQHLEVAHQAHVEFAKGV
jgi:hypothetical protein